MAALTCVSLDNMQAACLWDVDIRRGLLWRRLISSWLPQTWLQSLIGHLESCDK